MKIHWYGHAAFLIETEGRRIILDPYRSPDSGGYGPIAEPADVVVVSHENDRYHSHLGQVIPPFEVVRALELTEGGFETRGLRFEAIRVFESPARLAGDEVAIVHFRAEGLHVVFLGDLGHALDEAELAPLRRADLVLIPAGGPPTIDFPLIAPILEAIDPRVVVPMHFKTPRINLDIQPVSRFYEAIPDWIIERANHHTLEISKDSLPGPRRVVTLEHSR